MSPWWSLYVSCIYRIPGGVIVGESGLCFVGLRSMCDINCSSAITSHCLLDPWRRSYIWEFVIFHSRYNRCRHWGYVSCLLPEAVVWREAGSGHTGRREGRWSPCADQHWWTGLWSWRCHHSSQEPVHGQLYWSVRWGFFLVCSRTRVEGRTVSQSASVGRTVSQSASVSSSHQWLCHDSIHNRYNFTNPASHLMFKFPSFQVDIIHVLVQRLKKLCFVWGFVLMFTGVDLYFFNLILLGCFGVVFSLFAVDWALKNNYIAIYWFFFCFGLFFFFFYVDCF